MMVAEQFERTERIVGAAALDKLKRSKVLLFGIGGVGSYVAEAMARAGIGSICMVDKDVVDITNLNRQIPALHSTIGKSKVEVMSERIRDINPECDVTGLELFFLPESELDFEGFDYVVDAVDTVTAKIEIIRRAKAANVPVISSMGTGNKLNPQMFKIADISQTKVCPLAKVMRRELKKRDIKGVKVLYSEEEPKSVGGSISFVPSVAGLMIAAEIIKELMNK